MPNYNGRVLFFHGYTQSSSIFYAKTSALRKRLIKLNYKCIYLNGPTRLMPSDLPSNDALSKFGSVTTDNNDDTDYRSWWVKPHLTNSNVILESAFDTVKDYVNNNRVIEDADYKDNIEDSDKDLPIVGLVGFSQGSAMVGLLLKKALEFGLDNLQFVVLYAGFKLDTSKGSGNEKYSDYYGDNPDLKFKILHVYGELDTVMPEERVMSLYNTFKSNSDLLKHPGGHFVPNSKAYVDQVTNWIQSPGKNEKRDEKRDDEKDDEKKKEDDIDDLLEMMDTIGKA